MNNSISKSINTGNSQHLLHPYSMKGIVMETTDSIETTEKNYYKILHTGEVRRTYGELIDLIERRHVMERVVKILMDYNCLSDVKVGDPCCDCGKQLTSQDVKSILIERMTLLLGGDMSWVPEEDLPNSRETITSNDFMECQLYNLLDEVLSDYSPDEELDTSFYKTIWSVYKYDENHLIEMERIVSENSRGKSDFKNKKSPTRIKEFREYLHQVMKDETELPMVLSIVKWGLWGG